MQKPTKFRAPGSPAGTFPSTPWWHCTFYDAYERVNVWSHGLPGLAFLIIALGVYADLVRGGIPLAVFCLCAATTHLASAITHVYPDDHVLEKMDHIGIVALILGTPVTALMAVHPHGDTTVMSISGLALLVAAFFPPVLRTVSFVAIGSVMAGHYNYLVNANLGLQLVMYVAGAVAFVRGGGHRRWQGCSDHHMLHYLVTAACCLHVWYIREAMLEQAL